MRLMFLNDILVNFLVEKAWNYIQEKIGVSSMWFFLSRRWKMELFTDDMIGGINLWFRCKWISDYVYNNQFTSVVASDLPFAEIAIYRLMKFGGLFMNISKQLFVIIESLLLIFQGVLFVLNFPSVHYSLMNQ